MIFLALINNITLIIALSILYSFIIRRWKYGSRTSQAISGFLFGAVAVVGMMNPLTISPGLIFDGRSIIISIAGFLGGWVTALIAALMGIIYRTWLGGPGAIMGVSVIASSAAIGIAYHYIRRRGPRVVTPLHLIGFGIIVHICMLALTMTLPSNMRFEVLSNIAIPVILIYPFGTLLICVVLLDLESRIRAEDDLRESEEKYRNLFENAAEAIFVVQDGKLVFLNPMAAIMTGYSGEELMARQFAEFIHTDDRDMVIDRHVRRMKGEEFPHIYSFRIIHKDGNIRWVELNAVLINWKGKASTLNFLSNITERKRAEDALKTSLSITLQRERETSALLAAARAVIECHTFTESARRIFDTCREATGAVSGYVALLSESGEENEVLFLEAGGLPCDVDPSLPMPIRGLRAEAYCRGEVVYENDFMNSEWVRFIPSGHAEMRNVMFAPLTIDGKVTGVIGLANKPEDFTKDDARIARALGDLSAIALRRIRIEEALRESEEKYRNILESINDSYFETDLHGNVTFSNPMVSKSLGYSPEEMAGMNHRVYMDPENAEFVERNFRDVYRENIPSKVISYEVIRKDRTKVHVETSVSLIKNKDGHSIGYRGISRDVTERKQAEEEKRSMEERLNRAEKMESLGLLAGGVAHDLN
ncbi:MAG: PAS domain S-box protein, partial [Desulfobacterales bacterium]|nr:PAS domain S-box protein [Desulfobacterales bacterium]